MSDATILEKLRQYLVHHERKKAPTADRYSTLVGRYLLDGETLPDGPESVEGIQSAAISYFRYMRFGGGGSLASEAAWPDIRGWIAGEARRAEHREGSPPKRIVVGVSQAPGVLVGSCIACGRDFSVPASEPYMHLARAAAEGVTDGHIWDDFSTHATWCEPLFYDYDPEDPHAEPPYEQMVRDYHLLLEEPPVILPWELELERRTKAREESAKARWAQMSRLEEVGMRRLTSPGEASCACGYLDEAGWAKAGDKCPHCWR